MVCQVKQEDVRRIAMNIPVSVIADVFGGWPGRINYLRPKNVLELGTGQGASGVQIMSALPPDATFTTINYVDGHHFGEQRRDWYSDPRKQMVDADTIDPDTLALVPDGVDLLFIDTTHEAWHAAEELRRWQAKLVNAAIVVVDDLDQHDMAAFWESLPYEKVPESAGPRQGMFRYDTSVPYEGKFDRPEKTTYGGKK